MCKNDAWESVLGDMTQIILGLGCRKQTSLRQTELRFSRYLKHAKNDFLYLCCEGRACLKLMQIHWAPPLGPRALVFGQVIIFARYIFELENCRNGL